MILQFSALAQMNMERLMQIYAESNMENAACFYPHEQDRHKAVRLCEDRFYEYLKTDFYTQSDRIYWILEEEGQWVAALRTSRIKEHSYYVEALETKPECRRRGCAVRLFQGVMENLQADGPFSLWDCVSKDNTPSVKAHLKCGFKIAADPGFDYLQGTYDEGNYGMQYEFLGN